MWSDYKMVLRNLTPRRISLSFSPEAALAEVRTGVQTELKRVRSPSWPRFDRIDSSQILGGPTPARHLPDSAWK